MLARPEFAADERCVVETHVSDHIVGDRDLAAAFAIEFNLDESVRSWDAAFEMNERPESRRDFSARVAGRAGPHAQHPGGQVVSWSGGPCVTSAAGTDAPVPVFLTPSVAARD